MAKITVTASEAINTWEHCLASDTKLALDLAQEIKAKQGETKWAMDAHMFLVGVLFQAGRLYGIRQEREAERQKIAQNDATQTMSSKELGKFLDILEAVPEADKITVRDYLLGLSSSEKKDNT